jgi:hypothetical protein
MGQSLLTSIHGKLLGLTGKREVIAKGYVASEGKGNQIRFPGPRCVAFFDDFLGDVLADQWNTVEGTDSSTTDAAVLAGGIGGVLRLTSGDAGTGLAADLVGVTQALQWQASNGDLCIQARVKLSRITNAYAFIGFTDVTSLEAPIVSAASANTLTSNATDAVGFMFDTRMTTDNWWAVGVANDVDATADEIGSAPVADDYATFRIDISTGGVATFYYNGVQVAQLTGAVTAGADLTPCIYLGNTSGTSSFTMDVDYAHVAMSRAADGDAT